MSYIDESWLRKAHQALKGTLDVDADTKRHMIQFLFDEGFWDPEKLNWESAVARFNGCLNPSKSEFFKLGEIWALMLRFDRHQLFVAMAENFGYEVRALPTGARRQALLERIAVASERCANEIADARAETSRLELSPPEPRTAIPGQRAQFSRAIDVHETPRSAVERVGCP